MFSLTLEYKQTLTCQCAGSYRGPCPDKDGEDQNQPLRASRGFSWNSANHPKGSHRNLTGLHQHISAAQSHKVARWKSSAATPADAEYVIIHRWVQSKPDLVVSVPVFWGVRLSKKKPKSWRFSKFRYDPPVLLFWSVTIRSAVQQTFSYSPSKRRARQKAHQSSDSCPMSSLFLATGGVFLLQRVPCAVVQSLSPAHRFLHTPSDIPLALSFPSLSPFKQDSNSSTQVLSTLLLLFLHRHLLLF